METRKIWMRLGATVSGSKEEIEKVLEGDTDMLKALLEKGNVEFNGETYIPFDSFCDFNEEYGTDYEPDEVEFDL